MREPEGGEERVWRSHAEARRSYDRMSAWYDLMSGNAEWKLDEKALLLLDPRPGEALLEIGFGTGRSLEWIRNRTGGQGRIVGIDLSEGMREVASRRLSKASFDDVELLCGDALDLPFDRASFDAVFMAFTLELFDTPELPTVLQEVDRVLRADGRLVAAALSLRRVGTLPVRLYRWAHRSFPRFVDCRPIPVRQLVSAAGFAVEDLREEVMWGIPVDLLRATKSRESAVRDE